MARRNDRDDERSGGTLTTTPSPAPRPNPSPAPSRPHTVATTVVTVSAREPVASGRPRPPSIPDYSDMGRPIGSNEPGTRRSVDQGVSPSRSDPPKTKVIRQSALTISNPKISSTVPRSPSVRSSNKVEARAETKPDRVEKHCKARPSDNRPRRGGGGGGKRFIPWC